MNRQDILKLQSENSYPSVSILMPTHRTFPDNKQDSIRLKNLAEEVKQRLAKEFSKKDLDEIFKALDSRVEKVDFTHSLDGLALFVSNKDSHIFHFPFPLKERIIIDKTFATRDLVFGYNRSQPFYVVVINEKQTKILVGSREYLWEVTHKDLPVVNFVREIKETETENTSFNDRVTDNEERLKIYLREIDAVLRSLIGSENTNFVVTGTERQIGLFKAVTKIPGQILGSVNGSYENSSPSEIAKLVWPVVKLAHAARRKEIFNEVEKAAGAKKLAGGIDEVWKLAHEGRGLTLLTEINYAFPAKLDSVNNNLIPADIAGNGNIVDDAVDEIIENIVSKNGKVVFFDNGALEKYNRIALILRY